MAGAQANIHTYLAPLTGSGRIAPTLLEDITLYDPHFQSQPGRNLLADGPINFGGRQHLLNFLPEAACRHVFLLQSRQTRIPKVDERPDSTSIYQVTAVCQRCRIHICLKVDYSARGKSRPCPNQEHPVHHLIRSTYWDNIAHGDLVRAEQNTQCELYAYECSSSSCAAVVFVCLNPEILNQEAAHILVDPELLKQRTDEAFAAKSGDTEGMRRPSALDVLTDLRTYIRNAWKSESKSEISLDNKRFAVRFGPGGTQCASVLETMAFVLKPGIAWQVPKPNLDDDLELLQDPHNIFLDNVEHELSALILSRPDQERHASQDTTRLQSADLQFARVLGCQDYDQLYGSRTAETDIALRPLAFIILGVPQQASDELISHAYDWQCAHHVQGAPHYLHALHAIAMQRSSEILDTKFAIEQSNGRITYDQLIEAYRSLGLSMNATSDEDHIIGTFESRVQDAKSQETHLRECLRVIGIGLNSTKIVDYAAKEISTYEQALLYLGATHDMSDEFVQSMYTLKVNEHASQQEMAAKAVKLIAMHRRSEGLNAWVTSGFANDVQAQMDIGEAYQTLEISDRTMDDYTILAVYNMRKTEVSNSDRFTRALTAIAQDRNSPLLLSALRISMPRPSKATLSEPVGLDNIGNTCYLNSLLQFLFTIKVVRDIVLDFDQYKMDPTPENMSIKKVGQRKISLKEVETAQKFVMNLATLFRSMITAPTTAIRPDQELARLTLETNQVKEKIRRRSTLADPVRPSLGTIDEREIQGPLPVSALTTNEITEDTALLSPEAIDASENDLVSTGRLYLRATDPDLPKLPSENSSEATLVSRPNSGINTPVELISTEQQQAIFDNKENLAPSKPDFQKEINAVSGEPLRPASPSKINVQAGALANKTEQDTQLPVLEDFMSYEPPPGPPPMPPRKPVVNSTSTLEEYARQQDVTEVVGHCLFQLSCATRPTGFDETGEQQDEIHDLFFGECRNHTVPEKTTPDAPLPFLNIQAAVINQPPNVYAALDNYFDLSDAGNGRQGYISVTQLPPILTITLGRVVWDSKSKSQIKLNHHVEMPQTLYMDRYLESDAQSHLTQTRQQSWRLKQELADLLDRKTVLEQRHAESADVPALFDDARRCLEYLEKEISSDPKFGGAVEIEPRLKNYLGEIAGQKRDELENAKSLTTIRGQQLRDLFTGMESYPYQLHAAFFHRGSHGSGHYWVYIHDHASKVWRKYNDDHVTVVNDLAEIFDKPSTAGGWSGPANPYFLVYVRQGHEPGTLEELVETVKREPVQMDSDSDDGINIEPLGSGPAVARGLLGMSSSRAHNQMAEVPPDSIDQRWTDQESDGYKQGPVDLDVAEAGHWAGGGLAAAGKSLADDHATGSAPETTENAQGGWQHVEDNPHVQW